MGLIIYWLCLDADGRQLAWAGIRGVGVIDLATRKTSWSWDAPGDVYWVAFTSDGRHLITHNANQTVYVFRLRTAGNEGRK
jgi:hypothetical protein